MSLFTENSTSECGTQQTIIEGPSRGHVNKFATNCSTNNNIMALNIFSKSEIREFKVNQNESKFKLAIDHQRTQLPWLLDTPLLLSPDST